MTRFGLRRVLACAGRLGFMALALGLCIPAHAQASLVPGASAPSFTLPDTEGRARSLSEWTGRPVVLNFWAFWCDTWKAELPSLRALSDEQSALGFSLVAVSVDGTRVPEFTRQRGAPTPFPTLLDTQGKVSRAYGIAHVPTVVILDARGHVRYTHIGYPGNDAVLSVLRRLSVPAASELSVRSMPAAPALPRLRQSTKTAKPSRRVRKAAFRFPDTKR